MHLYKLLAAMYSHSITSYENIALELKAEPVVTFLDQWIACSVLALCRSCQLLASERGKARVQNPECHSQEER